MALDLLKLKLIETNNKNPSESFRILPNPSEFFRIPQNPSESFRILFFSGFFLIFGFFLWSHERNKGQFGRVMNGRVVDLPVAGFIRR